MARAWVGLVGVVASACSFSFPRETPITSVTSTESCRSNTALADAVIGAGLLGAGTGALVLMPFADGDPTPHLVAAGVLAVAGTAFLLSARGGTRDAESCRREVIARMPPPSIDPEPAVVMTCEQRRLETYRRAVTAFERVERVRLLATLPTCTEREPREKAWALTRSAALKAAEGSCDEVEPLAREVYALDIALHDVVLLSDVEIKFCLSRREL